MNEEEFMDKVSDEVEEKYKEAVTAYSKGDFEKSRELLEEIIENNQDFAPAYNKIGVMAVYDEDLEEAEQWFSKALSIDDQYLPSLLNLGNLHQKKRASGTGPPDLPGDYKN